MSPSWSAWRPGGPRSDLTFPPLIVWSSCGDVKWLPVTCLLRESSMAPRVGRVWRKWPSMTGGAIRARRETLTQRLPGPFSPPRHSVPRGSPQAWWLGTSGCGSWRPPAGYRDPPIRSIPLAGIDAIDPRGTGSSNPAPSSRESCELAISMRIADCISRSRTDTLPVHIAARCPCSCVYRDRHSWSGRCR